MAYKISDVIARARSAIGDATGQRADDTTCLGYAIQALQLIKGGRPDLFVGQFSTDLTALLSTSDFPLDLLAFMPTALFVGAMIESQDDASADRARGQMLAELGTGALK